MAKPIDLTDRTFGLLTVKELDPEPYVSPGGKRTRRWRCTCECGKEIVVLQNALTGKNGTKSCGCQRKESTRKRAKDLTGKTFGYLKVQGPTDLEKPEANGNRLGWICECRRCGKVFVTTNHLLLSGRVLSCGCLLAEKAREKVVEKNVIGHYQGTTITAIQPDRPPNKNNKSGVKGVYWSDREQRWVASIGVQGKNKTLGRFRTLEDAAKARKAAEEKYYAPLIEAYDESKKEETSEEE